MLDRWSNIKITLSEHIMLTVMWADNPWDYHELDLRDLISGIIFLMQINFNSQFRVKYDLDLRFWVLQPAPRMVSSWSQAYAWNNKRHIQVTAPFCCSFFKMSEGGALRPPAEGVALLNS